MFEQRKIRELEEKQIVKSENIKQEIKKEHDSLPWASRIDERVDPDELEECIQILTSFYQEQAKVYEEGLKNQI